MNIKNNIKDIIRTLIGEVPTKVLIKRGLKVGKNFSRQQGCFIDPTHCWLIKIGNNVTFSIRVTVLAHDASTSKITGYTKIGRVVIGDHVFVGANSTILLGAKIGDNVIIGANSVVTHDIPSNCVVAGNPAKVIYKMDEFEAKERKKFGECHKFSEDYTMRGNLDDEKKNEMIFKLKDSIGYVK